MTNDDQCHHSSSGATLQLAMWHPMVMGGNHFYDKNQAVAWKLMCIMPTSVMRLPYLIQCDFNRYFITIFILMPRIFHCDFMGMPGTFIGYFILMPRIFHCDFIWMPRIFHCDFILMHRKFHWVFHSYA